MRVRVLKMGDMYYPQSKGIIFWKYFWKDELTYDGIETRKVWLNTKEEAIVFLQICRTNKNKSCKTIKEVISEFNL